MKNSLRPLFLLHQTLQLTLCIGAGSILLASTKSLSVRQTARWWGVIYQRFHCTKVQRRRVLHHSSRHLALRMVSLGLCVAARPWKPIWWSSRRTVFELMFLPEAVWNLVVSVATEDRQSLQSCSVCLCDLPLRGWAIVAHRRFHFTMTALTVDRCGSSRAEIWWTDLLERWKSMTVPRRK
jgi:hypothetical protein